MKTSKSGSVRCQITVRTRTEFFSYHGIFRSTCDALLSALDLYGCAHVCVRAIK